MASHIPLIMNRGEIPNSQFKFKPGAKALGLALQDPLAESVRDCMRQNPADHYAISLFRLFAYQNEINILHQIKTPIELLLDYDSLAIPDELTTALRQTLDRFPGIPLAVRSSEENECKGTGIFETSFFVPLPDTDDLERLTRSVIKVYASWFGKNGTTYRKKHKSQGMGLRIEPVIGTASEGLFMPLCAGTALNNQDGKILIRTTPGLGTAAVQGEGETIVFGPRETIEYGYYLDAERAARPAIVSALSPVTGKLVSTPLPEAQWNAFLDVNYKNLINTLFLLREHGKFYMEWAGTAVEEDSTAFHLLQLAELEEQGQSPRIVVPDRTRTVQIASGNDTLNPGHKLCNGIVMFDLFWSMRTKLAAEIVSGVLEDYLMIVPTAALSLMGHHSKLEYHAICNAGGVLEVIMKSLDSTDLGLLISQGHHIANSGHNDTAATHFAGICNSEKIPFLAAVVDLNTLWRLERTKIIRIELEKLEVEPVEGHEVPSTGELTVFNVPAIIEVKEDGTGSVKIVDGAEEPLTLRTLNKLKSALGL